MALHHNPRIVTDSLIMHLDAADRNSYPGSGTAWYDLSGNGINAQHYGTDPTKLTFEDRFGGALKFDAASDNGSYPNPSEAYMRTTSDIPSLSSATVTAIFENATLADGFTNTPSAGDCVIRMQNSDITIRPAGMVAVGTNYNDIQYVPSTAIRDEMLLGNVEITTVVFTGTTVSLYRQGQFVGTQTAPTSRVTEAGLLNIGTRNDANYENFSGWIYNLSIYNRALTAQEVLQNYNATKTRFGL